MADSRPTSADGGAERADGDTDDHASAESTEELRRQVEEEYDFENFGPRDMARMSPEEWDAAFDADSWITGIELIERVEADLRNRIANREVFARLERVEDGLLAYSDEGYAVVYPDGSVEGRGTVVRDVKPTVALCSMDEYDIEEPPEGELLPDPMEVPEGGGELGNQMLQVVAAAQLLTGLGLFVAWIGGFVETIIAPVVGLFFVLFSLVLFLQVANARLSDKFRSEEYRNRLRAVGIGSDERPDFLPERYRDDSTTSLTENNSRSSEHRPTEEESDDSSPSA